MSRVTVLNYATRLHCQNCGRHSEGRSLAGDMVATATGWRCPPGKGCSIEPTDQSTANDQEGDLWQASR